MARLHNDDYQVSTTNSFVNAASTSNYKTNIQELCYFCGNNRHARRNCPAASSICLKCQKRGHFARVCKGTAQASAFATQNDANKGDEEPQQMISCIVAATTDLNKTIISVILNGSLNAKALIDTGSTASFIDGRLVLQHKLQLLPCNQNVSMAASNLKTNVNAMCSVNMDLQGHVFQANLLVIDNICTDFHW